MVYCPECETDLDIDEDEVDEGAVVSCPECGSDFEVITVNPIELKLVGEDEVDEEEEEDEKEDEKENNEDEDEF
jgi:alpha-aminoadipate carrier protein LysW